MRYLLFALAAFCIPATASAHAFGLQYTLPLPVSFYVTGGVAAFLISCFLLIFVQDSPNSRAWVATLTPGFSRTLRRVLTALFVGILLLGLVAGVFGHQAAFNNILPVLFWIGLVLLVPYLSAVVDGFWDMGNPFRAFVAWILRLAPSSEAGAWRFGYLPALIGYIVLIILELFLNQYTTLPIVLAGVILLYLATLVVGSKQYGIDTWFWFAEFFSLFFRLAGKMAPVQLRERRVSLSLPTERLAAKGTEYITLVIFILFALAATAYDGISETALLYDVANTMAPIPVWAIQFVIFTLMPVLFFGLYALSMRALRSIVGGTQSTRAYMMRFIYSFVPIMLAYHFAHYFPLLVSTGITIVPLFADPFALGWNLFGLSSFDTATALIGADTVWYVQLASIVLGHAFAAYVAHHIALREFGSVRKALASQLPLIVLMVFYTAFGLWILAQPFAPGVV